MSTYTRILAIALIFVVATLLWPRYVAFKRKHKFGFSELFFVIGLFALAAVIVTALMGKIG